MHRYNYASGNPVNRIDPSGRANLIDYAKTGMLAVNVSLSLYALGQSIKCIIGTEGSILQVLNAGEAKLETLVGLYIDQAECAATAAFAVAGLGELDALLPAAEPLALAAPEETTALSTYRMTTEGETFYHYGYAENAAGFEGGLRPGGFATSAGDLSGAEAQSGLALPHATPPNAVYTVTPEPGTWIRVNPVTESQFGQPGGLPEYQFPGGTGPGTVSPPTPILPR